MKPLTLLLIFSLLGCKTAQNTMSIVDTKAIIISFNNNKDNFLFPIKNYNKEISLEDNLKKIKLKGGKLLGHLTQTEYEYLCENSIELIREDVPIDFSDDYKKVKFLVVDIKYKILKEYNHQILKEYKKTFKEKIMLENNLSLKVKYNYLILEIIKISQIAHE